MALKDALLVLQAEVSKDDTFNGTGFDLASVSSQALRSRGPLFAEIEYRDARNEHATQTPTFTFSIDHSDDNSTWTTHSSGASDIITTTPNITSGGKWGVVYLPIATDKRYVRLTVTKANGGGGGGTNPNITYKASIVISMP